MPGLTVYPLPVLGNSNRLLWLSYQQENRHRLFHAIGAGVHGVKRFS